MSGGPLTEDMRARMLAYYQGQIRTYFGDGSTLSTDGERYQYGIRLLVLRLIPLMTERSHRVSEFLPELMLSINELPTVVRDVVSGQSPTETTRWDYAFGYHSVDVPVVFDRVPAAPISVHI
jgi:hypothetical protein